MSWLSDLDDAAGQVTCSLLGNDGVNAGLWATVGGALAVPTPASKVAGGIAGLGLLALENGCNFDPNSGTSEPALQVGCSKFEPGGYGRIFRIRPDGSSDAESSGDVVEFTVSEPYTFGEPGPANQVRLYYTRLGGEQVDSGVVWSPGTSFELRPIVDTGCAIQTSGLVANPPAQVVTGTTTDCNFKVEFKSWFTGPEGVVQPVYKISSESQLRESSDVVGGCSFDPIVYIGTGGGRIGGSPPPVGPWNPDFDLPVPGTPPWLDLVNDLVGGVAGNILYDGIKALLEQPWAGTEYRIDPSCPSSGGSDPELPVVIEIPALKGEDAIITRLDALVPLLQAQKDLKQPICRDRPTLEGEWRTISFRSEETSPFGKSRLRKRFRYRSLSGFGLEQLVDYWANFSFEAGPVIVIHKGASWGTPQVWASTADEGKRVIRHAGGEAGLDPDQVGQWEVSSSRSARYGVSGTMKIDTTGGYYWITERDGSNGRPIVIR